MNQHSIQSVEAVAKLWNSGVSIDEIVARTGRTKGSIHYLRKEHRQLFAPRTESIDSEDIIAAAVKLWNRGLKEAEVAAELGVTQSRIRGLIKRNAERFGNRDLRHSGWRRTLTPTVAASLDRLRNPQAGRGEYEPGLDALQVSISERLPGEPIGLMELTARTCRWPDTDGPVTMFCGGQTRVGKSYCPHHYAKAHRRPVCEGVR